MGKPRSFHESKTYERDPSLLNKTSLTVMPPQPEVFVWIAQAVYGPSQDHRADKTRVYGERLFCCEQLWNARGQFGCPWRIDTEASFQRNVKPLQRRPMQSKVPTYTVYRKIRQKDGGFLIYLSCSLRTIAEYLGGGTSTVGTAESRLSHPRASERQFSSCRPSALKGVDSPM